MKLTNYQQYQLLLAKEHKRHNKAFNSLREQLVAIQQQCSHKSTTYYPDPSGNNDSFHECNDCGKQG